MKRSPAVDSSMRTSRRPSRSSLSPDMPAYVNPSLWKFSFRNRVHGAGSCRCPICASNDSSTCNCDRWDVSDHHWYVVCKPSTIAATPAYNIKTRAFVVVVLDAELPMNVSALATTTRRRSDTARLLERGQYGGEAILISVSLTSALAGAS